MPEPEQTSPADVASVAPVTGAEPAASVETQTPPVAEPVAAPEQTSQTPDHKSLLKDPEFRKLLLADEEVQRDLEHRATSEAGRRAKAQVEAYQRQQQEEAHQRATEDRQRQLDRLAASGDLDLVPDAKEYILQDRDNLIAERGRVAQQQRATEIENAKQAGAGMGGIMLLGEAVNRLYTSKDLSSEEYETLQPNHFRGPQEYRDAVLDALAEKRGQKIAEKMLKERLPAEVEAQVQERLGRQREGASTVPALPNGTVANNEKDFLAAYRRGETDDHARAQKILAAL